MDLKNAVSWDPLKEILTWEAWVGTYRSVCPQLLPVILMCTF